MTRFAHSRMYRSLNGALAAVANWMERTSADASSPAYCAARARTFRLHDLIHRLERRAECQRNGQPWTRPHGVTA